MRITEKDLNAVVERINLITKSPTEPYKKMKDGKHKAQIGCYHLSHAYGGVALHRMCSESGGVHDVFYSGHVPKKDLYAMMQAFIKGIEASDSFKE